MKTNKFEDCLVHLWGIECTDCNDGFDYSSYYEDPPDFIARLKREGWKFGIGDGRQGVFCRNCLEK